jgi:hypothetical protein
VLCSEEAARANGLCILVRQAAGEDQQSRYTVIARHAMRTLLFDGVSVGTSPRATSWHWLLVLHSGARPDMVEIGRAFSTLNIIVEHLCIHGNGDSSRRSDFDGPAVLDSR